MMTGDAVNSAKSGVPKLLSICMMGRDDDYMLDFKYRITTTINYLARNLKQLGRLDEVEILVTDWGSEVPLAQTLPLSPEAGQICRFLYVPPAVVCAVQQGREGFHISFALNAGLRRAIGKFVVVSPTDTLITWHGLEAILELLKGNICLPVSIDHTYFFCSRYRVPWQFVKRQPTLAEWDRYLLLNTCELQGEESALFSLSKGAGVLMMHRSLWHDLRGTDERLGSWGWHEIEMALRVTEYHPWVELSSLGVVSFHMDHPPSGRRAFIVKEKANPRIYNLAFQINDENWGLGNHELEIQTPKNVCAAEEVGDSSALPRESDSPKVASWAQSWQEIAVELTSPKTRDHAEQIIGLFLGDWAHWDIDFGNIDALSVLSWYSQYRYPRRYLEFGIGRGYTAAVVAAGCPSVEIYGIDRWKGVLQRHTPLSVARMLRKGVMHCGYVRFINGEIGTAVQQLRDSFIGSFDFDLVLVRGDLLGSDAVKQVSDLLPHLAGGGALVFTCGDIDRFASVWHEIRRLFPQFTYLRCKNHSTGLILAASLRDDHRNGTVDGEYLFETKSTRADINRIRRIYQLRRLYRAIKKPAMYPEYVIRILRLVRGRIFSHN